MNTINFFKKHLVIIIIIIAVIVDIALHYKTNNYLKQEEKEFLDNYDLDSETKRKIKEKIQSLNKLDTECFDLLQNYIVKNNLDPSNPRIEGPPAM
ncbi:hypothetical protein [Italian clover phyllody phytoplasma]|uniref:hypothetical protein n=1 Tax=Italian clover phyllody phytoplasma TaxID=1196420 RepID=UPI000319E917|nr:hypothetical protein [Italian clover phyllody phytoplasma]